MKTIADDSNRLADLIRERLGACPPVAWCREPVRPPSAASPGACIAMSDRLTSADLIRHLENLDACPPALAWCLEQPAGLSAYALYRRCPLGEWLLWLAVELDLDRRLIVLGACDCAETALVYLPADEPRPRLAIETARAWARGEATLADVREAAMAARAARPPISTFPRACAYSAANAAFAAARASSYSTQGAYAAFSANAANYAAYSAAHSSANAAACAAPFARAAAQRQNARLVRRRIPWRMYRDAINGINGGQDDE